MSCLGCCDNRAVQQTDSHMLEKEKKTEMKTGKDSYHNLYCNYAQWQIVFGKCSVLVLHTAPYVKLFILKKIILQTQTLAFVQKATRWVLMYVPKYVFEPMSVEPLASEPCSPGAALQRNAPAYAPLQPLCIFQP